MAIFRFDNLCERFAMGYVPISHDPTVEGQRGKRFFRQDSARPEEMREIAQQLTQANKTDAFMSVVTALDIDLTFLSDAAARPNFLEMRQHVLFWARQAQSSGKLIPNDELAQADAKARAAEMASDFVTFLDFMSDPKKGNHPELAKTIDWESVEIATLPVTFNGWWCAVVNLSILRPRELCPAELKYDMEQMQQHFGITKFR